jgi:hypothetical protein
MAEVAEVAEVAIYPAALTGDLTGNHCRPNPKMIVQHPDSVKLNTPARCAGDEFPESPCLDSMGFFIQEP